MNISGVSHELRGLWPVAAVEAVVQPIFRGFVGARLTEEEIDKRKGEIPQHDAELGVQGLQDASEDDEELRRFNAAMVMKAYSKVENQDGARVPPRVAAAVIHMTASLPPDVVRGNRYVPEDVADKVTEILRPEMSGR